MGGKRWLPCCYFLSYTRVILLVSVFNQRMNLKLSVCSTTHHLSTCLLSDWKSVKLLPDFSKYCIKMSRQILISASQIFQDTGRVPAVDLDVSVVWMIPFCDLCVTNTDAFTL